MYDKLVIVESPSKSKTIENYLGKEYHVTSSKGHIRDLSTSGKEGLGMDQKIIISQNMLFLRIKKMSLRN